MKRPWGFLRKMTALVFPWPARHERKAAIDEARAGKQQSQQAARDAGMIARQLQRMADENHWADTIADQIIQGHRNGGRR